MNEKTGQKKGYEIAAVAVLLLFCEWFFFRNIIGTGVALIGDRGDGRLTNLLTEHWWNFFNGKEKFSEIAMFYPAEGVFGYTDLFLGYGLIYSLFRFVGLDMFVSYKYTLIVVHVMGTASMYYLMNRKLKCNVEWSLFGTISFCFSDTYARHLGHTQLNAVSMLPFLLILFMDFITNYETRWKRNSYAYATITWFVLLTYTSWYIACFTGIFCLVFLITYFIKIKTCDIKVFSVLKEKILFAWKDIMGYIIYVVILYIPFIKIYLPVLKSSSGYSYTDCINHLPEFADIINVSDSNFMLGKFIKRIGLSGGETSEGFSIILLGLFITLFIISVKKESSQSLKGNNTFARAVPNTVCISILVSIALILKLSSSGVSLWAIVYYVLPVARSMRAVARFLLWLSFPMAIITAYMANKHIKTKENVGTRVIPAIIITMLFVSNINTIGVSSHWNQPDESLFISGVSTPPENAEIFYIIDTANTGDPAYIYQLDAFEIATWYALKTINGYSGQSPPDWGGIWDVCSPNYENNVWGWIEKYNLTNVYAYDRSTNTWIPSSERISLTIDDVFCPADDKFSISSGLKDRGQGPFAWTDQNFETTINNAKIKDTGLIIKMQMCLSNYMAQNNDLIPYVQIYVDDMLIQEIAVTDEYVELNIPMSGHDSDMYNIKVKTNCYFNPKQIGQNEDTRDLSIAMYYIGN